jgi:4'-phosphopantetheinyl transferase EntD
MLVLKLNQTLTIQSDEEWQKLCESSLSTSVHEQHKLDFIRSRIALRDALNEAGLEVSPQDLKLTNFSTLEKFPNLTISLSHTKTAAAALIADKSSYKSVGIDIELCGRKIKPEIIERISSPHDHDEDPLKLWCAKEAAFKALVNSGMMPRAPEFSSIEIQKELWNHPSSGLKGPLHFITSTHLIIAQALIFA